MVLSGAVLAGLTLVSKIIDSEHTVALLILRFSLRCFTVHRQNQLFRLLQ